MNPNSLFNSPNALAKYYKHFSVDKRILLTGHSHQAWPDCSRDAQLQAWDDAAMSVDDKWDKVFERQERVRKGFLNLLDDDSYLSFGQNTHELLVRFLSALPLKQRPKLLTSAGEFHSISRQLSRLEEENIQVIRVLNEPISNVVPQLIDKLCMKTAAVLISSVFFQNGQILEGLDQLYEACQKVGAELLIDTYHHLNVVPFSIKKNNLENAYVLGGGYKYCQLGEGVCFLRYPKSCELRPVITGWFADFEHLDDLCSKSQISYTSKNNRFAGATFDPTSFYRAAAVFEFFKKHKLTVELLRTVSQHQIALLADRFDNMNFDPQLIRRDTNISIDKIGGFLALKTKYAKDISEKLKNTLIYSDVRSDLLRLGPAPYISDDQLHSAMDCIEEITLSKL